MSPTLDRQEAERLAETYADLILRLAYTYLNHTQDAQDICQTVFLKLWEKAPAFVSPDHERAWIIRTTANTCKDLLKSHWRKTTAPLEAAAAVPAPQPEEGSLLAAVLLPWFVRLVEFISPKGPELEVISRQIANAHTAFNVCCALLWLPFLPWMVRLVCALVPEKEKK